MIIMIIMMIIMIMIIMILMIIMIMIVLMIMIMIIIVVVITIIIVITMIMITRGRRAVLRRAADLGHPGLRGWWNTFKMVPFEISISMKLHPSAFHSYTGTLRPMKGFLDPNNLDEVSNPIPPTSRGRVDPAADLRGPFHKTQLIIHKEQLKP